MCIRDSYIGVDLSAEYCAIAEQRLAATPAFALDEIQS